MSTPHSVALGNVADWEWTLVGSATTSAAMAQVAPRVLGPDPVSRQRITAHLLCYPTERRCIPTSDVRPLHLITKRNQVQQPGQAGGTNNGFVAGKRERQDAVRSGFVRCPASWQHHRCRAGRSPGTGEQAQKGRPRGRGVVALAIPWGAIRLQPTPHWRRSSKQVRLAIVKLEQVPRRLLRAWLDFLRPGRLLEAEQDPDHRVAPQQPAEPRRQGGVFGHKAPSTAALVNSVQM
jgi:hypothetical protein